MIADYKTRLKAAEAESKRLNVVLMKCEAQLKRVKTDESRIQRLEEEFKAERKRLDSEVGEKH